LTRSAIELALARPGSRARNERGALSVQEFKRLSRRIWPKETMQLSQDRTTGAAGNDFGRTTAPRIAAAIGAAIKGPASNEATWSGKRIVIKCARASTNSVGVSYRMLDRLESILAAFERSDGRFDIFEMEASVFAANARETRSKGASAGKVGLVPRTVFQRFGRPLRTVTLA
jgi:hypothetical protein